MPLPRRRNRTAATPASPELCTRIFRAIWHMRRVMTKPPELTMPMPSLGRTVDSAKVHACLAIDEVSTAAEAGAGPPSVSVKDVADLLGLEHSTASRLLGEAEADGLVVRGTDPQDRRRTTVELTADGRAVVRDSDDMRTWAMGQVFSEWSERDLKTLATMLERMSQTLGERMPEVLDKARERVELNTEG